MKKIIETPYSDALTGGNPFASMGLIKFWLISTLFLPHISNLTRDLLCGAGATPNLALDKCIGA
tara:strand:- start:141 stop:332 length:192 start_codon:yes stop_codon:yes gene_type:complete